MSYYRIRTLRELQLPAHAVVVADRALPEAILGAFDAPVLVDAGEGLKTLASIERLAARVLEHHASRPMTLVGVGGGSVGDAVGFLASILWRGVALWHVPTTLLAMVDSAHGGKTAVNLGSAKNQLGTFYPADRVVLADAVLETLPIEQREQGLVELIKGLWLGDAEGLGLLERDGGVAELAAAPIAQVGARLMELIERAVAVKTRIVARDPREEKGVRTFLNLGHTAAHALELLCGLSHGQAVAWGMVAASRLSQAYAGLAAQNARRLRRHLYPLIRYNQALVDFADADAFTGALSRDKKRRDGRLRSVLLCAPGEPSVTDELAAEQWLGAFEAERARWLETPVRVALGRHRAARVELDASKSELNRALVIAHLHPHEVEVDGESAAADVWHLRRALATLTGAEADEQVDVFCGEGGTTLRFLLAVAANRPGVTRLYAAPGLLERPHQPLVSALRRAGASVEPIEDAGGVGFRVEGWQTMPVEWSVSAETSSQFASALALLGATGEPVRVMLEAGGGVASRPYLGMTLRMLERAGVDVDGQRARVALRAGDGFAQAHELVAAPDESSAAVWRVARFLGLDVEVANASRESLQPDARIDDVLERLEAANDSVVFDLGDSPDLVPVLAAAAVQVEPAVEIRGVAHLRHKESNRIEDLCEAFARVGVEVEALDDGLRIPPGGQRPREGGRFATFSDHRLAMAGLLLTVSGASLVIEDPWVIAKSYPALWHDARTVGWTIIDSADRSADT